MVAAVVDDDGGGGGRDSQVVVGFRRRPLIRELAFSSLSSSPAASQLDADSYG